MQKCKELNNGNHKSIFFKNKRTHRRNRTESGKSEPRRRRKRFYIVSSQRAKQSQASFHQGAFKACGLFQVLAVFYAGTGGMHFSAVAQNRAARIFRQTQGIDRSQRAQIFSYEKIGAEKGLSLHVQLAQRQVYTKRLQSRETGKTSRLLGGLSFGQGII